MKTLGEVLLLSTDFLAQKGVDTPRLDCELLLAHALELTRVQVYLNHDRPLNDEELATLREAMRRRAEREPLAWILGHKEFYARDFQVLPGVLVPRPDTETLIEVCLQLLPEAEEPLTYVADIGCGTGCVGLTLAAERAALRLYSVDLSDAALACTKTNTDALGIGDRVAVLKGDLLDPIPTARTIDWVVSNPPYISSSTLKTLAPEVSRQEPSLALDGGVDGLDIYRRLLTQARERVTAGLVVEIGHDQGESVPDLFERAGFVEIEVHQDLGKRPRVVSGRQPTP